MELHWTYDYDYHHGLSFRDELLAALASRVTPSGGGHSHIYTVLPNYWQGFDRDAGKLAFGEATITRASADGGIEYSVSYRNEASGEDLMLRYLCEDGPTRELLSPWTIESANDAASLYDSFAAQGRIIDSGDERSIALRVGQLDVPAGIVDRRAPLICNWSLFDVIPRIEEPLEFTMIEDLEKLKPHSRIQKLEDYRQETHAGQLVLSGHVVLGEGNVPSYWWVDTDGNVAIMANTYTTFVLRQIG